MAVAASDFGSRRGRGPTEWGGSLEVTAILLNHIIESILIPGLDLDVVYAGGAESADEGGGEAGIREEGDVEVYGCPSDLVAVGKFQSREVFRDIDHHINFFVLNHFQSWFESSLEIRIVTLAWPEHLRRRNTVLYKILIRATCGVKLITLLDEKSAGPQHISLLERITGREQNPLLRNPLAD